MRLLSFTAPLLAFVVVASGSTTEPEGPPPAAPPTSPPADAAPPTESTCIGKPGTIHGATIDVGGERRV